MSRSAPDLHLPATKAALWSLRRVSCVDLRRRAAAFRKSASAERDGSPCPSTTISRSTGLPFEVDTLNLDLTVQEGMPVGPRPTYSDQFRQDAVALYSVRSQ